MGFAWHQQNVGTQKEKAYSGWNSGFFREKSLSFMLALGDDLVNIPLVT